VNTLRNSDRDLSDYGQDEAQDREISLGTGTILGIFFALALLCAVFFGFGYSMGRKSAQTTVSAADGSQPASIFSSFKPSAGKPADGAHPSPAKADDSEMPAPAPDNLEASVTSGGSNPGSHAAPILRQVSNAPTPIVREAVQTSGPGASAAPVVEGAAARTPGKPAVASPSTPMPAASSNGTMVVQIAAVSHQEDADLLLSALKQRGYPVFLRQEAQDQLIHVQVGPFAAKKDADAMRQRLLSDGYNAILK